MSQKDKIGSNEANQSPQSTAVSPTRVRPMERVRYSSGQLVTIEEAERYAEDRVAEALAEMKRRADELPVELANKAWMQSHDKG